MDSSGEQPSGCDFPRKRRWHRKRATAKLGVVGGTVYFTAKEGLWGNSKETNDAYKRLKSKTLDEWLPASVDMKPSTSKKLVSKPLTQKKEETPAVKSQQPSQYNADRKSVV